MDVRLKRVYEPADAGDGVRVLVDRLWPRGLSKQEAQLDEWVKECAPSSLLRRSWHADPRAHEPDRFRAFAASYREELERGEASAALDALVRLARTAERVTLVYGAKDERINHAVVLREALIERAEDRSGPS